MVSDNILLVKKIAMYNKYILGPTGTLVLGTGSPYVLLANGRLHTR